MCHVTTAVLPAEETIAGKALGSQTIAFEHICSVNIEVVLKRGQGSIQLLVEIWESSDCRDGQPPDYLGRGK